MKTVSIQEFSTRTPHDLASRDILTVKGHDQLVGFYISLQESDAAEVQRAMQKLSETVNAAMAESGWDEETLSQALDLSIR